MDNPLAEDLDHILTHTEGLWEEIRGKRLFITGGTGFIGCWLLESFAWANDKLGLKAKALVLTRNLDAFKKKAPHLADHPDIQFHLGDVRFFEFPTETFSHIIHAATESSTSLNDENPLLMFDTIVQGTRHALDFARYRGVKKFLLTSSGAVYGKQPPEMTHIPEDYLGAPTPTDPRSAYGEGKRVAELLCTLYGKNYGLETKIARCFAFVGPYLSLDSHFAIGNFIRDGIRGGPIYVKGDGLPFRSYLYAADLMIWLWTILFRGMPSRPYNVGSEAEVSITELAKAVSRTFHPEPEIRVAKEPTPDKPSDRYIPSTRRSQRNLNLRQHIQLFEAIQKTTHWCSDQRRS